MHGYLLRAEADEALRKLGELRHLIEKFNEWSNQDAAEYGFTAYDEKRADWHEDIVDLATEVVGL